MSNYQLYRTNIFLGGQMKWDITVDSGRNGLCVSDFHLSPVSKRIPFVRKPEESLLSSTHLSNIHKFYKDNEGSFYKTGADPILTSLEPIISSDTTDPLYDSTIDMGLSRSAYRITGKQMEFFCPVWLENFDPDKDTLVFDFSLNTINPKTNKATHKMISKSLHLAHMSDRYQDATTHDRFVDYFLEYVRELNLNSNVINIDLRNRNSCISGVNLSSGAVESKRDIPALATSLLDREMLMMDVDNLIIKMFEKNHLVARQLFNFNFVFGAEELLTPQMQNMLKGSRIGVNVNVRIVHSDKTSETLELRDFYTNYDFIKRRPSGYYAKSLINFEEQNVFDEIKDNQSIELLNKNKVCQNVVHWSLDDNNDYIFNLYTGFGGYHVLDRTRDLVHHTHNIPKLNGNVLLTKLVNENKIAVELPYLDKNDYDWMHIRSVYWRTMSARGAIKGHSVTGQTLSLHTTFGGSAGAASRNWNTLIGGSVSSIKTTPKTTGIATRQNNAMAFNNTMKQNPASNALFNQASKSQNVVSIPTSTAQQTFVESVTQAPNVVVEVKTGESEQALQEKLETQTAVQNEQTKLITSLVGLIGNQYKANYELTGHLATAVLNEKYFATTDSVPQAPNVGPSVSVQQNSTSPARIAAQQPQTGDSSVVGVLNDQFTTQSPQQQATALQGTATLWRPSDLQAFQLDSTLTSHLNSWSQVSEDALTNLVNIYNGGLAGSTAEPSLPEEDETSVPETITTPPTDVDWAPEISNESTTDPKESIVPPFETKQDNNETVPNFAKTVVVAIKYKDLHPYLAKGIWNTASEELNHMGDVVIVTGVNESIELEIIYCDELKEVGINKFMYQDSTDIWTNENSGNIAYGKGTSAGSNWVNVRLVDYPTCATFKSMYASTSLLDKTYDVVGKSWCGGIKFNKPFEMTYTEVTAKRTKIHHKVPARLITILPVGRHPDSNIAILKSICTQKNYIDVDEDMTLFKIFGGEDMMFALSVKGRYNTLFTFNQVRVALNKKLAEWKQMWLEKNRTSGTVIYDSVLRFAIQLTEWMNSFVEPFALSIQPINYTLASSPSNRSTEVEHLHIKGTRASMMRYDGAIRPAFVDPCLNNIYYKKRIARNQISLSDPIFKYTPTGFKRVFPSIGYYPWNVCQLTEENGQLVANSKELMNNVIRDEYKWFTSGAVRFLNPELQFMLDNNGRGYDTSNPTFRLKNYVIAKLQEYYNVSNEDATNIYDMYELNYTWSYVLEGESLNTKYDIKLQLK